MKKVFKYRVHIHFMQKYVSYILLGLVVFMWIPLTFLLLMTGGFVLIEVGIGISLILIFEAIFLRYVFKIFTTTSITLSDDSIRYVNNKKEIIIRYEDIKKIKFPSLKYLGGWIKIISKNKNIRLTVVVENIQDLLVELKKQLDDRGLSHNYNDKRFFNFYKTASYSDDSWRRLYKYVKPYILFESISCVLVVIIGILTDIEIIVLLIPFTILLPLIIFIFFELIYIIRHSSKSNYETFSVVDRDIVYENKVTKVMYITLLSIYFPIVILSGIINYVMN